MNLGIKIEIMSDKIFTKFPWYIIEFLVSFEVIRPGVQIRRVNIRYGIHQYLH